MANTKDITGIFPVKILLFGGPGTGKTLFYSSLNDVHVIDTEAGLKTLAGLDIEYETFLEDPKRPGAIYPKIVEQTNKWLEELPPTSTLVIDSLSVLHLDIYNYVEHNLKIKDGFKFWEAVLHFTMKFIDGLLLAPCNVVVTTHEKVQYSDTGAVIGYSPRLYGQSADAVPYRFDEVYRLSMKPDGGRIINTDGNIRFQSRSRLNRDGILPKVIEWKYEKDRSNINPVFSILEKENERLKSK